MILLYKNCTEALKSLCVWKKINNLSVNFVHNKSCLTRP